MATLKELLLEPARRPAVVDDCVQLVDDEVRAKTGLGGMAVKGAFVVVKKLKPGIIRETVDNLLDDFVARLESFYVDFEGQDGKQLEPYFTGRAAEVANALLGVTDDRAARAKNKVIKKAYGKLRPTGVKHTEAAVPGLARVIDKHT
ncbi:MAG: hypothetical protein V3T05_05135 [Myxococcota bacterium]